MTKTDVIRAWKDPAYRACLTDEQRAALPANPAGVIDVTEAELTSVEGGGYSYNPAICRLPVLVAVAKFSNDCPYMIDYGKILTNPANPATLGGMTRLG